jgi:DNA-binding MurR/RpiR family transcriptional regulator
LKATRKILKFGKMVISFISVTGRSRKTVTVLLQITELPNPTIYIVNAPGIPIRPFSKQLWENHAELKLPKV